MNYSPQGAEEPGSRGLAGAGRVRTGTGLEMLAPRAVGQKLAEESALICGFSSVTRDVAPWPGHTNPVLTHGCDAFWEAGDRGVLRAGPEGSEGEPAGVDTGQECAATGRQQSPHWNKEGGNAGSLGAVLCHTTELPTTSDPPMDGIPEQVCGQHVAPPQVSARQGGDLHLISGTPYPSHVLLLL